jgi:hypothetical protein
MLLQTCGAGRAETIWRRWRRLRAGAGAVVTGAFVATKGGRCGISRAAGGLRGKGRRAGTRDLAGEGGGEEEGEGGGKTDEALRRWGAKKGTNPPPSVWRADQAGPGGLGKRAPLWQTICCVIRPSRSEAIIDRAPRAQQPWPGNQVCHAAIAAIAATPGIPAGGPSPAHSAAHRSPHPPSPRQNRHRTYKLKLSHSQRPTPNAQ